jgi:V/A-type H+-transporting ATPase subunit E
MEVLKKMIEENAEVTKIKSINEIEKLTAQINKLIDKNVQLTIGKLKEIEDEYSRKIDSLKKMIVSNAEMNVRNSLLKLYSEYVDKAISLALEEIHNNREIYLKGLDKLLLEAIENIGENKVKIYCNPEDKNDIEKITKKISREKNIRIEIKEKKISEYGGVIATNESETVVYNNTIEARLERMKEDIRKIVGDILRE